MLNIFIRHPCITHRQISIHPCCCSLGRHTRWEYKNWLIVRIVMDIGRFYQV
ncbi:unnamed protein product [Linum tenue]|uniref:Uncharacterized protein n=1 Tax=Linum tenue TaxID=586396 RepID=A0AAV0IPX0_9ROSI|nr:unnamed protein product [Linum tenue]